MYLKIMLISVSYIFLIQIYKIYTNNNILTDRCDTFQLLSKHVCWLIHELTKTALNNTINVSSRGSKPQGSSRYDSSHSCF